MKINGVCKTAGLTKKAVEYYQLKDIIKPKIDEKGYREFSDNDIEILKKVRVLRDLGLSVTEIKPIIQSKFPREELRKCLLKKQLENDIKNQQTNLLEMLSNGENQRIIEEKNLEINRKKTIKEKLLDAFPGFYGRFYLIHFSQFLNEPITTPEQQSAYETIVQFLDELESLKLSDELLKQISEAMDFWTVDRLNEFETKKKQGIENPEQFFRENEEIISRYLEFKKSEEYKSSCFGGLMEAMKLFKDTSGYNDVFIPAMRKLSPSYEAYYQSLLKLNDQFLEKYPNP